MPLDAPRWRGRRRGSFIRGAPTSWWPSAGSAPGAVDSSRPTKRSQRHAATLAARHPDSNRGWGRARRRSSRANGRRGTAGAANPPRRRRRAAADGRGQRRQHDAGAQPRAAAGAGGARRARRRARGRLVRQVLAEGLMLAGSRRRRVAAGGALGRRRAGRAGPVQPAAHRPRWRPMARVVAAGGRPRRGRRRRWSAWRRCGPRTRPDVRAVLQDAGRRRPPGASAGARRLRSALVVGQVALAAVLAVQAGLLTRSFAALLDVDPGFAPDHLLDAPGRRAGPAAAGSRSGAPSIASSSLTCAACRAWSPRAAPPACRWRAPTTPRRSAPKAGSRDAVGPARLVGFSAGRSHDYFAVMRIPVRHGQLLQRRRWGWRARQAAVVNETAAAAAVRHGCNPVGRRLGARQSIPTSPAPTCCVAVVGDVRHGSLDDGRRRRSSTTSYLGWSTIRPLHCGRAHRRRPGSDGYVGP